MPVFAIISVYFLMHSDKKKQEPESSCFLKIIAVPIT